LIAPIRFHFIISLLSFIAADISLAIDADISAISYCRFSPPLMPFSFHISFHFRLSPFSIFASFALS